LKAVAMRGFLLIDKAAGLSSFDVIRQLRKITGIKRIGHCGTLDPFATGLLICALGSYTRLNSLLEAREKSYQATLRLGQSTTTGDPEGEVEETASPNIERFDASAITAAALALQELPVPKYSAVKIQGQRAYKLMRQGVEVEIAPRAVQVHSFQFLNPEELSEQNPYLSYACTVSKGTYIRSLSIWIAAQMQTVAHTVSLRRTAIGDISVDAAVRLDEMTDWQSALVPCEKLFGYIPSKRLDAEQIRVLQHGQSVAVDMVDAERILVLNDMREIETLGYIKDGNLHPKVNF
jgi:tRNA pseudouridine55 synthase